MEFFTRLSIIMGIIFGYFVAISDSPSSTAIALVYFVIAFLAKSGTQFAEDVNNNL